MRAAVPRAGGGAGAAAGGEPVPSSQPSPPRPPPLSAPLSAAPLSVMLGLETPVVVVRLPGKRPRARPWSQAEEARLTRVCQDCWPDVDWPSVAHELGQDVRDCISQSTLLHLQELARGEAPASPPQPPSPLQSQPAQSGEQQQQQQQQQQQHEGSMPTSTAAAGRGSEDEEARMASDSMHRRGVSSSSSISSSVTNNLLPSEVAALALQHQFDWAAVGKALKADPWECWKTYETYSQDKTSPNGDSPLFSGPTHGPIPISSLADDVAAFLPFASSPSPLRSNPLAPPYDLLHHYHPPDPSSFTAAAAASAAATAYHGENRSSSSTISSPTSPPPPVLSSPVGAGGPSFLHHFPRPNSRARLPFPPHAPASSTTATTTTTPAASFLRSFSASSFHQPSLSPGGGGEGQAQHPVSLPAGLQDSAYSNFSGMGGGGGGASTFLPGSESMSLSMLQSAMLDMPSLYLGQSTAFGAGASTFLGGGGSTLFPPGAGAAAGAGGGAGAGAGGLDGLLPPFPPPTAPPFVSSSPMLQPLPRGLGGPTPAIIPATIMEGSGTAEGGGSSISNSGDETEVK